MLRSGRRLIAQTPNILLFLGERLRLAPADEAGKLWAHQLELTILDLYQEVFHTHHPLGDGYAYEEQKAAARRRTKDFLAVRLPKFLGYFERVLELNRARGPWMVGARLGYVDLSMAQLSQDCATPSLRTRTRRCAAGGGYPRCTMRCLHGRALRATSPPAAGWRSTTRTCSATTPSSTAEADAGTPKSRGLKAPAAPA